MFLLSLMGTTWIVGLLPKRQEFFGVAGLPLWKEYSTLVHKSCLVCVKMPAVVDSALGSPSRFHPPCLGPLTSGNSVRSVIWSRCLMD
jgi:hypothetical protein